MEGGASAIRSGSCAGAWGTKPSNTICVIVFRSALREERERASERRACVRAPLVGLGGLLLLWRVPVELTFVPPRCAALIIVVVWCSVAWCSMVWCTKNVSV